MNQLILIVTVRREEVRAGDVRQSEPGVSRDFGQSVNRLVAVGVTEHVRRGVVERRTFFQVSDPVSRADSRVGGLVVFDRVLVDGGVDQDGGR